MNTYTEPEFLAVAETLGYRRVNQSSRMGGTALAATDGGVVFVRDWEKCATPDDVERLLACYHSLERKNRAAAALGRMGGASTSPAKRAASRANGAKGGRPRIPRVGETFAGVGQTLALRVIAVDGTDLTYDLIDRASGESVLGGVPRTRSMVAASGGDSANHPVHYWIEHETGEVWHLLRPIA